MKKLFFMTGLMCVATMARAQFERPAMCTHEGRSRTCQSIKVEREVSLEKMLNNQQVMNDIIDQTQTTYAVICSTPKIASACKNFCPQTYASLEKKYKMLSKCSGSDGAKLSVSVLFDTRNPESPIFLGSSIKVYN